ncbi:MAG: hypothetical protein M1823_002404 [Watsoniomyces obsoletus]|nr:MAG: hypothetical protein M1823_002404 [Watsoniomyces obsoletus]
MASVFPALGNNPVIRALSGLPLVRTVVNRVTEWRLERLEYQAITDDIIALHAMKGADLMIECSKALNEEWKAKRDLMGSIDPDSVQDGGVPKKIYTEEESAELEEEFRAADVLCRNREQAILIVANARHEKRVRLREEQRSVQAGRSSNQVPSKADAAPSEGGETDSSPSRFSGMRIKPNPAMKQHGEKDGSSGSVSEFATGIGNSLKSSVQSVQSGGMLASMASQVAKSRVLKPLPKVPIVP